MPAPARKGPFPIPPSLWRRSHRPIAINLWRFGLVILPVLGGLATGHVVLALLLPLGGVLVAAGLTRIIDHRLDVFEDQVVGADADTAAAWLERLQSRSLVRSFAPYAWIELQRARLELVRGNPRASARALMECGRLAGAPEAKELLSARAHAHLAADEPRAARPLLDQLVHRDALDPLDRVHHAIALLHEGGRAPVALAQLDRAEPELGDHPRWNAARVLAFARARRDAEAAAAHERLLAIMPGDWPDAFDRELARRARKAVRRTEAGEPRRASAPAEVRVEVAEEAVAERPVRSDPRKARRERRKQARVDAKARKAAKKPAPARPAAPVVAPAVSAPAPVVAAPAPVVVAPAPLPRPVPSLAPAGASSDLDAGWGELLDDAAPAAPLRPA